jgi:7-cyano-7-deazaguanine synthase
MNGAIVLLSGGMDSATLLHHVVREHPGIPVHALSFLYGQKHARELEMASWQADAVGVAEHRSVDIAFFGALTAGASALTDGAVPMPVLEDLDEGARRQPPTYVPNRNMVLLALAAAYAEARGLQDVFYGAQAQDEYGYWDCTVDFVGRMNDLLRLNRGKAVRIHAPFAGMSKAQVVRIGCRLGVDYAHTWTCYSGGPSPCGTCPSCREREQAFRKAGIGDPLVAGG